MNADLSNTPEGENGDGMKSYVRVFGYADRVSWCLYGVSFVCAIGAGVMLPLTLIVFGQFANSFTNLEKGAVDRDVFQDDLNRLTLYFIYIFIGRVVLNYIYSVGITVAAIRVTKSLRAHFLECTLRQEISYFDQPDTKSIAVQVTTNGNNVNLGISEKLGQMVQATAQFFAAFIVAFTGHARLAGITCSIIPVIIIVTYICLAINQKQEVGILHLQSTAGSLAEETFSSMRTVQAFWLQPLLSRRYEELINKIERLGMKKSSNFAVLFSVEFFCSQAGFALAFWQGTRMYAKGEVSNVGDVVTVIIAIVYAATSMTQIGPQAIHIGAAASAAEQLFKIIDREPEIDSLSDKGQRPEQCAGNVEVRDVHFAYPSRPNAPVLRGFSLSIPAKKTTALVGASGSGKSTIVGLLERWYDPNEGSLSIDGVDIRDLNLQWLRTNIRMVQQEPVLFNGTIYENVVYGLLGTDNADLPEDKKMEMVQEACKAAYADEFIDDLPEKYQTEIGERAIKLSGGQKQRLAIARSIITNPQILLLDEATSALDTKSEKIVQQALENVSASRTTLVIAHKLSTVRKADNIIVMTQGVAIEQGHHDELVAKDGAYARLVRAQDLGDSETYEEKPEQEVVDPVLTTSKTADSGVKRADAKEEEKTMNYNLVTCLWILMRECNELYMVFPVVLLGCLVGGLVYPAQAVVFSKSIAVFLKTGSEVIEDGEFWALMFFVIAIANFVAFGSLGWTSNVVLQVIMRKYRLELFQSVLKQDMWFFDKPENGTGELVSRLDAIPNSLMELLGINIALIIIAIINLLSSCILAIAVGWKLGLVITFGALPVIIFFGWLRIRLEMKLETHNSAWFARSAGVATEAVSSIRTVSSLTMERHVLDKYQGQLNRILQHSMKSLLWTMFWYSLASSTQFLAMALGFWYGGRLLLDGEYTLEQFFIVYLAVIYSGEAAGQFLAFCTSITKGQKGCNEILWFRRQVPSIREDPSRDSKALQSTKPAQIDCDDVSFAYTTRPDALVLKEVTVSIKPGQFVAFVGPSGCGKSTLVGLLSRFYDPVSGTISIDSQPLPELCPRQYRQQLALVQQEPVLYQGSIRENVAMGLPMAEATEEQIQTACEAANIFEFITSLPEGMNTLCGARGAQLSGGQRQRIAIARALIREPRLLLLDEATSALDTESERIVQAALEKAQHGRTTLAVAHRLSTIKAADLILVFEKGKIIESGSHTQLLAKRGAYYEMCLGQSLDREAA